VRRLEVWLLHLANLAVGGTGLVYAWMRYVATPADPFSVVGSPWQPTVQHLHVLFAPALVLGLGMVLRPHAATALQLGLRSGRRSGLTILATAAPMIASGYLLQTATEPAWRRAWIAVHLATSALWLLGYAIHQVAAWRRQH
jgi:hypothetical protein